MFSRHNPEYFKEKMINVLKNLIDLEEKDHAKVLINFKTRIYIYYLYYLKFVHLSLNFHLFSNSVSKLEFFYYQTKRTIMKFL